MSIQSVSVGGSFRVWARTASGAEDRATHELVKIAGTRPVTFALKGEALQFATGDIAEIEWTVSWAQQ